MGIWKFIVGENCVYVTREIRKKCTGSEKARPVTRYDFSYKTDNKAALYFLSSINSLLCFK